MSAIAEQIDTIVAVGLVKPLKQAGYRKKGRTFHLTGDSVVRVVNVQGSTKNIGDSGEFTINLGVYLPHIVKCLKKREVPLGKLPAEYDCTVRVRIGMLMPERKDHWWRIFPSSDLSAVATEVKDAWVKYGQSWLDQDWCNLRVARDLLVRHGQDIEAVAASVLLKEADEARKIALAAITWFRENHHPSRAAWIESRARELGVSFH